MPEGSAIRYSKRHADILRILQEEGSTTVADLAGRLRVSLETIRRDVRPLSQRGEVVKLHGAVALPHVLGEAPFERRMRENAAAKKAIARQAARHIADGDSIMLDTGTTTSLMARELLSKRRLTVVTNSSDIARTLATVNGNRVYMAGGELRGDNGAAFGNAAIAFVSRFRVRHAVISIGAMDRATGPMDYDLGEAEFACAVLSCGEQAMIVTDHTKFGRSGLVKVCDFSDFDLLITDRQPPKDLQRCFKTAGVTVELSG